MGRGRVLIVDDNATFLGIARTFVDRQENVEVAGITTCGRGAVDLAKRLTPTIVLIDLVMPGQNGLETIPKLRATVPAARIIAMSLHDDGGYRQAALEAGADHFIPKDKLFTELPPVISPELEYDNT